MKVAVTGGTGFVGQHLVRRLQPDGHEITILAHRQTVGRNEDAKIRIVNGSVEDAASLEGAFSGVEAVFHLVGIIAESKEKTFAGTVTQGTYNLVEACQKCGVKKIIYLSALGTSKDAPSKYHQSKYRAEQAIISSGLEYTIWRASVIFGQGDGFISMLTRLIKRLPMTPVIGDGRYKLQPIYIDNLVDVMARSLNIEGARNKIIDAAGPEKLEYLEILDILRRVLSKRRMNFYLPLWLMKFVAGAMENVLTPAPLTRDQLVMMSMGNTGDIALMKKLFSIEPISLEEGLKRYLR